MDTNQYMGMFMDESREHLQALNRCLLELEAAPGNLQLLDEIFRSAHTLKGMSATMGFHEIAEITHEMENVLDMLRKGQLRVTSGIVDLLFKCLDCLEQLVEGIAEGSAVQADTAGLIVQIRAAAAGDVTGLALSSNEAAATTADIAAVPDLEIPLSDVDYRVISAAMQKGLHTYEIQVELNEKCLLKAARAYLVFSALEEMGEIIKSQPQVAEIEKENFDHTFTVIFVSGHDVNQIQQTILTISEVDKVSIKAVEMSNGNQISLSDIDYRIMSAAAQKGLHTYEIQVRLNEACLLKAARAYLVFSALEDMGEIIKSQPQVADIEKENFENTFTVVFISGHDINQIQQTILAISEVDKASIKPIETSNSRPYLELVKDTRPKASNVQEVKEAEHISAGSNGTTNHIQKNKVNQTVRVDIEKLDTLLNLVGELVINKTRLDQIGNSQRLPELAETIESMDRITTDLQNVVMKVRMVPISQVFNRFPRMVRDLARDLSKEINLVIEGEETELDRTVIDEIGDPLVHLLRNAIDHGIEMPQDRIAASKPSVGEVKLVARQEGNNVVIEVIDNGKGINPEILKNKAVEKGLMTRAEADRLDTNEAVRIIFLPGFSTAQAVTDVSGRGVGMDAVRSKIESLGGNVEVDTNLGQGSRFTIRLPLTLAIIQALLISLGEEKYAIPLGTIDSTIKIQANEIKTIQGREVILLRGNVIPIVRLAEQLQAPKSVSADNEELYVVIVQMGEKRAGFMVDTLIGQQEIVIKSLGKMLGMIRCIAGATILGDGQVALILDVGTFMQ